MRGPCVGPPRGRGLLLAAALFAGLVSACGDGDSTVEPRPAATLTGPTFTVPAGETQNADIALRTNRASAGLQVEVVGPPEVLVEGIQAAGRASGLENAAFHNLVPGRARVLLFDSEGDASIPAGSGPALTLTFRAAATAPAGDFAIALENGLVIDEDGEEFDLTLEPGRVTITR